MPLKVLSEKGIRDLVARLLEKNTVVGPVARGESAYAYAELESANSQSSQQSMNEVRGQAFGSAVL